MAELIERQNAEYLAAMLRDRERARHSFVESFYRCVEDARRLLGSNERRLFMNFFRSQRPDSLFVLSAEDVEQLGRLPNQHLLCPNMEYRNVPQALLPGTTELFSICIDNVRFAVDLASCEPSHITSLPGLVLVDIGVPLALERQGELEFHTYRVPLSESENRAFLERRPYRRNPRVPEISEEQTRKRKVDLSFFAAQPSPEPFAAVQAHELYGSSDDEFALEEAEQIKRACLESVGLGRSSGGAPFARDPFDEYPAPVPDSPPHLIPNLAMDLDEDGQLAEAIRQSLMASHLD